MTTENKFDEWALVELFGHQKIVGRVSEASLAGGAFLRVDVPEFNGEPAFTRYFGPGAIYSINPVSEQIARDLATRYRNQPVNKYELPQLAENVQRGDADEQQEDPEDYCDEDD